MNFPLFDFVTGWGFLLSFITFAFCLATLKRHVDEKKVREEKSIAAILQSAIPPERVLTATGLMRVRLAKVSLIAAVVFLVAIGARQIASGGAQNKSPETTRGTSP